MPYPYYNMPNYQQMTFPQYQQPVPQAVQPMPQLNNFQNGNSSPIQQTAPIQTGFVRVQSEEEARRYPVAPGGSITFIDDNSPHCYVKTAGLSQLDAPVFKRFRLVEEAEQTAPAQTAQNSDTSDVSQNSIDLSEYAKSADLAALWHKCDDKIKSLWEEVDKLRFDIDAVQDKSTKRLVQRARKDADEDE